MLDLESVRLFVLVVDFGNLTRAAQAAGTVQPVVSQRLRALEAAGYHVTQPEPSAWAAGRAGWLLCQGMQDEISAFVHTDLGQDRHLIAEGRITGPIC